MPLSSSHGMGTSGMVWWLNIDICLHMSTLFGVYNIAICTGASYPGFLYSQWGEIDTCQVLSCSRGGYVQPRSACCSPLLNKITWRAMSDVGILALGTLSEKTPILCDSASVVWGLCSSSPAIPCLLRKQADTQQKKAWDKGRRVRHVYRVSLSGRNATLELQNGLTPPHLFKKS